MEKADIVEYKNYFAARIRYSESARKGVRAIQYIETLEQKLAVYRAAANKKHLGEQQ